MDFTLLGDVTARHEDHPIHLVDMTRKLLAILLYYPNNPVPRGDIRRLLWGSEVDAPRTADELMVQYASRLRKALSDVDGERRVVTRPSGFLILVDPAAVDWHEFRRHLGVGRTAHDAGDLDRAAEELWQGLDLWKGEPLADVRPRLSPLRMEMDRHRLEAAELLAGVELDRGAPERVVGLLSGLEYRHPDRERLVALLIRAQHATGQRSAAIATYRRSQKHMTARLGLDPAGEVVKAFQDVLHSKSANPSPVAPLGGPAQVPQDTTHYTGRAEELAMLRRVVPQLELPPDAVPAEEMAARATAICAIDGMAGVGKTAFAIHAAHQFAPWFPDAQLFLDLHAHSENAPRIEPAEALERLLRALGVNSAKIPQHLDERAALYRAQLAGRRVLILLDNAYNADHVRPLIPAAGGCLMLITSRRRLTALDDAHPLSLDTLPPADAVTLLTSVAGPSRLGDSAEVVERIVELCGRLPLAIRIVAARLRSHTARRPDLLAERLADVHLQLAELDDGERSASAAFTLSYRDLGEEQRRAFRLLGLVPGRDIDTYAAAALLDAPVRQASRLLQDLLDAHLLGERVEGRYLLHDLMRRFAAGRAGAEDSADDQRLALRRWLDHQLRTATAAMDILYPRGRAGRPVLPIATPPAARSWLDLERANLIAAAGRALEYGRPNFAITLDSVLYRWLISGSHYLDALELHKFALHAAKESGDRAAEGIALGHIGNTCRPLGLWEDALDFLRRALEVHHELGDRVQQANTVRGIGMVLGQHGHYRRAIDYLQQALALERETGNEEHQVDTLTAIGNVHFHLGEFDDQVRCYQLGRQIATRIGDRLREAGLLCNLGALADSRGKYADAIVLFTQAMDAFTEVGDRDGRATVLSNLGEVHRKQGHHRLAMSEHEQALSIFREVANLPGEGMTLGYLASTYASLGQFDQSHALYENSLAIARRIGSHPIEVDVLNRRGDAYREQGGSRQALAAYHSALALADRMGAPYERARGLRGIGLLLEADGQPWTAHWHLRQAGIEFAALRVVEASDLSAYVRRFSR